MEQEIYYEIYDSLIGKLTIAAEEGALLGILFGGQEDADDENEEAFLMKNRHRMHKRETPLIQKVHSQLGEYFCGRRRKFEIPCKLSGTTFQQKVWKALDNIPYGETRSYRDIAEAVGSPKSCRAVGMANHHNPIPIIIPCHRVIGANGKIVGYGGGLEIKKTLLDLEAAYK